MTFRVVLGIHVYIGPKEDWPYLTTADVTWVFVGGRPATLYVEDEGAATPMSVARIVDRANLQVQMPEGVTLGD